MRYSFGCVVTLLSLSVACFFPRSAWSAVMTFDSLAPDFSEITTYTEDGITFAAVDGAPEHFHPEANFNNGTTGVVFFSDDGSPFRISFGGGALFSLLSIEVYDVDDGSGPIVFSTSGGATQNVDLSALVTGIANFGPAFAGVSFVQIDIPGGADGRFIAIDNITVGSNAVVPEPSTLGLALTGVACLLWAKRNGRNQAQV